MMIEVIMSTIFQNVLEITGNHWVGSLFKSVAFSLR